MSSASPNQRNLRKLMVGVGLAITAVLPMGLSGCPCGCSYPLPFQPYSPVSIAIADFNSDGAADIAVGTFRKDAPSPRSENVVSVVLQNRNAPGTFQTGIDTVISVAPSALATGDLNGTGGADVVVAGGDSPDVAVLLQSGSVPAPFLPTTTAPTGRPMEGARDTDVAVGDLNGDGALDIAVADSRSSGEVVVLLQNPASAGQFLAPLNLSVGNRATAVAIGDINGDGRLDLVAASASTVDGWLSVFLGNALVTGQFMPRTDIAVGGEPKSLQLADLNGDGRLDIAVANSRLRGVAVLLQNPVQLAAFLAPVLYPTSGYASDVAVADLNGDSRLDLVVVEGSSQYGVAVLLQSPSTAGAFLTPQNYAGVELPYGVAIGDLNNDGLPDIAVAAGNRATVLLNIRSTPGSFTPPLQVGAPLPSS